LRERPIPPAWLAIVERAVPYYGVLTPGDQGELLGHVQVFLAEKRFEGCGGQEITDEVRVTIAAQACLLLLHRATDYFPKMQTILVYPRHYFAQETQRLPGGIVAEGIIGRAGESWYRGPVVLAWDEVQRGAAGVRDGHNVVLHEFAHQLDAEWGGHEGAPALPRHSMYADWARVLGREYQQLCEDVQHGRPTVLNGYGAKSPAEFFAVATEAFFERAVALRQRHSELYEQLRLYYQQDPAARSSDAGR
jgi:MtfA peptidase